MLFTYGFATCAREKKLTLAALSSNAGIGQVGIENELNWERSALSMHAKDRHKDNFSLKNFSVAVIKQVSPHNLR